MSIPEVQEPPEVPHTDDGGRTTERTAPHIGDTMGATRGIFRQYMAGVPHLRRLAHYTHTDWDFSVGSTGDLDYDTIGCNVVAALTRVNDLLAPVGTGALIRTVVHGSRGALICASIVEGEQVVAVAPDPTSRQSLRDEPTRLADMAVAAMVTEIRDSFGQRPQAPGGYGRDEVPDPFAWTPPDAGSALESRIRAVLDPVELQYVAVLYDGSMELVRDVFDEPAAEVYFRAGYTPAVRRDFYARFLPTLERHAQEIGGIVNPAVGRGLRRLVLDVQRGAIYYYRVDPRTYLVGVTLNQDRVPHADLKTEWLSRPPSAEVP
ncbi:hypothetical protein [Krasilnikovia sp. MM14-A1259]|uniref:hypothetical protein n=1 Tax=Krasilnikovia sp. MM14-A1259 TaxID=3373539 RepID=UPI00380726E2